MSDSAQDALDAGMAHLLAGRWEPGAQSLRIALQSNPQRADVWSNLGYALREMGRAAEAREALQQAVGLDPSLADSWNLLGLVAAGERKLEEAVGHFDRAIALRPGFGLAWMNRANAHQARGARDKALTDYARALELVPGFAQIHYNLGHLHHKSTGDLAQAIAHYREALRLEPRHATAHHNLSHALYLQGEFGEAWSESRWRPKRTRYERDLAKTSRAYSLPTRDEIAGAHIIVISEQGLGDALFYLRFAPALRELGATLDFAGLPRIHAMLARTGLFERVATTAAELDRPGAFHVLAGDLALIVQQAQPSIVLAPPLKLAPDASRLDAMRSRLGSLGPPPYTALAWRSGETQAGPRETLEKELPFEVLARALPADNATLISVQRSPRTGETELLASLAGRTVHDLSDINVDLDDCLALMAAADDYVGVSSTLVHLRASAGGAGRVFVPFPWEWRWMARGDSPWFPGMTVIRQTPGGRWPE